MPGYKMWKFHGESCTRVIAEEEQDYDVRVDRMDEMLEGIQAEVTEDPSTIEVEAFFKL
jgi:nitrogenase molybdenum-iron protein alpha/beta subunit